MISREEALKRNKSDWKNAVDDIYDSIGSCDECIYYNGGRCSTFDSLTDKAIKFCSDFERVKDDSN